MAEKKDLFTRLGRLGEDDDRLADYEHWERLGDEARFQAAWELVLTAHKLRGVYSMLNVESSLFARGPTS